MIARNATLRGRRRTRLELYPKNSRPNSAASTGRVMEAPTVTRGICWVDETEGRRGRTCVSENTVPAKRSSSGMVD